jgi:hypothetical protein
MVKLEGLGGTPGAEGVVPAVAVGGVDGVLFQNSKLDMLHLLVEQPEKLNNAVKTKAHCNRNIRMAAISFTSGTKKMSNQRRPPCQLPTRGILILEET